MPRTSAVTTCCDLNKKHTSSMFHPRNIAHNHTRFNNFPQLWWFSWNSQHRYSSFSSIWLVDTTKNNKSKQIRSSKPTTPPTIQSIRPNINPFLDRLKHSASYNYDPATPQFLAHIRRTTIRPLTTLPPPELTLAVPWPWTTTTTTRPLNNLTKMSRIDQNYIYICK